MSLYNALFGVNPMAGLLMQALGINSGDVPRFRDCYLDTEGERPLIAIHTRTGGGNRSMYESEDSARRNYPEYFDGNDDPTGPWNCDLRKVQGFVYDADDDFDNTYATFFYEVPEAFKSIIETMRDLAGSTTPPAERWQMVLDDLRSNSTTPEAQRALAVGEQIFAQIKAAAA